MDLDYDDSPVFKSKREKKFITEQKVITDITEV